MTNLFIDTNTAYQPFSVAYYQKMKALGVKANFVKVSEGNYWTVNKWVESFNNSYKAGLIPCVYHFLKATNNTQAHYESAYFLNQINNARLAKTVKIMIDAETNGNNTNSIMTFINDLKQHGYVNFTVYSGRYMWITNALDQNVLPMPWVASYNHNLSLGINNAKAWQYNDKFNGYSQDISKDLTTNNWFTTDNATPAKPSKPTSKPVSKHVNTSVNQGVKEVARDVLKGIYGNGSQRKNNIYYQVQHVVNLKASGKFVSANRGIALIADDVLFNGKYGNGNARKDNIYNAIQKEVNKLI